MRGETQALFQSVREALRVQDARRPAAPPETENVMKRLLILALAAGLGACASASKPGAMVAPVAQQNIIGDDSPARQAITVAEVKGGKETNPLWTSEVSNADFAEALRQSLAAHAMLAAADGRYVLAAELQKLKQPFAGFDMTVTATVRYTLTDSATGAVLIDEVVETPYTAKMGDAFVGVKRLQLANEGSIKANISKIIDLMVAKIGAAPAPAAATPSS